MTVALLGELLTANESDMTVSYNLLTFGEEGRTNKGRVTVDSADVLEIPSGHLPMNDEHAPEVNVGYLTASATETGVTASVKYYATPEGERAFQDATTGKRKGISMELLKPVIRAGKIISGRLAAAAIVKAPAFPSSMLLAADVGELAADIGDALAALETGDTALAAEILTAAQAKANEDPAAPSQQKDTNVPEALKASRQPASTEALLAAFAAGNVASAAKPEAKSEDKLKASAAELTLAKFAATLRGVTTTTDDRLKAAAFDVVTQADMYDPTSVPAYLGELWTESPYEERFAPLVDTATLTGMLVEGWRWKEGKSAVVDDWDPPFTQGNPAAVPPTVDTMNDIPTGEMVAERESWPAKRIAGGNRFDRVNIDFPVPGVMESFLRNQTEYIKRRRDARVREHLIAHAAQNTVIGTGADVANPWRKIILGAMHVMDYGMPTYAVVGNDYYRDMLGSDMLENLALLETTLGLKEGTMAGFKIQPASITDTAMNGEVLVGCKRATVLHEPAGAPIRVDAQELLKGAIDKAVFAYYLLRSDERGGSVRVTQ
jgi:hypothetical protein